VTGALETAAKWEPEGKRWHDAFFPGNELPGYYQVSLQDDKDLSPIGAIDSSQVL
jgi:hypothetical protein